MYESKYGSDAGLIIGFRFYLSRYRGLSLIRFASLGVSGFAFELELVS
jgi:hypothetical protein